MNHHEDEERLTVRTSESTLKISLSYELLEHLSDMPLKYNISESPSIPRAMSSSGIIETQELWKEKGGLDSQVRIPSQQDQGLLDIDEKAFPYILYISHQVLYAPPELKCIKTTSYFAKHNQTSGIESPRCALHMQYVGSWIIWIRQLS
jgi:hypothetical protein